MVERLFTTTLLGRRRGLADMPAVDPEPADSAVVAHWPKPTQDSRLIVLVYAAEDTQIETFAVQRHSRDRGFGWGALGGGGQDA
jgi:hypothetical protein